MGVKITTMINDKGDHKSNDNDNNSTSSTTLFSSILLRYLPCLSK